MSKMSEIHQEIVEMLDHGDHPTKIARLLGIPLSTVYDVLEQMEDPDENYSPFQTVNS